MSEEEWEDEKRMVEAERSRGAAERELEEAQWAEEVREADTLLCLALSTIPRDDDPPDLARARERLAEECKEYD